MTDESMMRMQHRPGCVPRVRECLGRDGGTLLYCDNCGMYKIVREMKPAEPAAPATPSPWRCPEHLTRVSWKGTGCERCAEDRRARLARKAARRAAIRARKLLTRIFW